MSLVVIYYSLKSLKISYENGRLSVMGRPPPPSLSLAPPLSFPNLKKNLKISYQSRRNLLEPQTGKNLLRKWSRFCKNIL